MWFGYRTLRRRLALTFGETTDPDKVERGEMLQRLVRHYAAHGPRKVRHVSGVPVAKELCDSLLAELVVWSEKDLRERPTIKAQQYMILCGPNSFPKTKKHKGKSKLAAIKVKKHEKLWNLARQAIESVDAEFAGKYTAVAFTKNFEGSPHIDTQNTGPFYGIALGDFSTGGGAICVECSAREVAAVDTRCKMGRVDGRYPHWVAPYTGNRYSAIFYQTQGEEIPIGPAVFSGNSTPLVDDWPTYTLKECRYYNCYDRETNTYNPEV